MTLPEFLAALPGYLSAAVIFVAMPLGWLVAALLWWMAWKSRKRPDRLLLAHAVGATALALIVTVFAFVFVNNGMADPPLNGYDTMIFTRGALLVLATIASLYWLRYVWRAA